MGSGLAESARICNVAGPVPEFVGRDKELAALRELLTAPGRLAVVALQGVAGVGKTQLARRYAAAVNRPLTWQIRAESRETAVADLAALAVALDLPADSDAERAAQSVVDALLDRSDWLLIFDDAVRRDDITDLVPLAGDGQVVITSRYPVWHGMATSWEVPPLSEAAATALLQPVDGDVATAAALARELGGLPLALAHAVVYCHWRPARLADYRTAYHEQPAVPSSGVDVPEPVVRTWVLNSRAVATDPAAIQLLRFLSTLAPLDVPLEFLAESRGSLPAQARRVCDHPERLRQTIAYLAEMRLLSADRDSVRVPRFGQEAVQAGFPATKAGLAARLRPSVDRTGLWSRSQWAECAARALTQTFAVHEDREHTIDQWRLCTTMLPHARAVLGRADVPALPRVELGEGMANFFTDHGEFAEAVALYTEALDTRVRTWGPDDPNTLVRRNDLANAMTYQGDYATARTHLDEVLAGNRRRLGPRHTNTINAINNLASALHGLGEHTAACQLAEEAYELSRRVRGPEDQHTLTNLNNFAVFTLATGDVAAARTRHEQAYAGFRRVLGADHPYTLGSLRHLAEVHRAAGDLTTARTLHQQAFDGRRRTLGPTHPDTLVSLERLASVAEFGGDRQTAAKLYWELGAALAQTWPSTARALVTVIVATAVGSAGARTGFDAFVECTADGDADLARFADALRQVVEDRTADVGDGLPADQRRVITAVIDKLSTDG